MMNRRLTNPAALLTPAPCCFKRSRQALVLGLANKTTKTHEPCLGVPQKSCDNSLALAASSAPGRLPRVHRGPVPAPAAVDPARGGGARRISRAEYITLCYIILYYIILYYIIVIVFYIGV